jgi:nucleoside-diphosphate-sugar epimerase
MRLLVTGATGFIGTAFIRLALAKGHTVAGLIRPDRPHNFHSASRPKLTLLKGTLAEPPWRDIEIFQPEVCVHLAWIATPGVYLDSPENKDWFEWSVEFIRALGKIGAKHIVAAGTCIEYRPSDRPLSEETSPIEPATNYARWKNALRLALEDEARTCGTRWAWGRVFYPYGAGEHPARLCSSIIHKLSRGEKIVLKTPESTKDYIYIDDLAAAFLRILEKSFQGAINMGTGTGVSVKSIANELARLLNRQGLVEELEPPQPDSLPYVVADATRLKSIGWSSAVPLAEGLRRLVEERQANEGTVLP